MAWTGAAQLLTQAIQVGVTILLTRFLFPSELGLVGYATLVTALVATLNELGLSAALIQRREISNADLDTAFWTNVLFSLCLTGAVILSAPWVALFFREPDLVPVLQALAFGLLFGALGMVHRALLERDLRFRPIAIIEVVASAGAGVVAVALALAGAQVWALVAWSLGRNLLLSIVAWLLSPWRPGWHVQVGALRTLFGFGSNIMGIRLINYVAASIDYLVVGRMLGTEALGIYTLAYTLVTIPQTRLIPQITRVAFPAMARLQDDDVRLRRGFLRAIGLIALIVFPLLVGLAIVTPEFVTVVYTERWLSAVTPIRLLVGAGIVYALVSPIGPIFWVKGRPDIELRLTMVRVVALTLLTLTGVQWGISGVAAGVLSYTLIFAWPFQRLANGMIGLAARDYIHTLAPALSATCVMSLGLLAWRITGYPWMQSLGVSPLLHLLLEVLWGALLYMFTLRWWHTAMLNELWAIFHQSIMGPFSANWRRIRQSLSRTA